VATTLKAALDPAVTVRETGWVRMTGGLLTITVKVPVPTFPMLSVAVTVTVLVPTGKVLPLAGEYVSVGVPPRLSVALAPLNVTLAALADAASTVTVPGTVTTGGVVSTNPPVDSVPVPVPEDRALARRKPRLLAALAGPSLTRFPQRAL
jgi:hypothetical protein